ncbi:MAG TPA: DUF4157 domain-containing protein [Candidatus Baltobacteraceae bacterium]|jgi:hypothetical protein|nr:DUF4157 domain-containing protein [Candidatus Baltobacteraceae bacterium]
MEHLLDNKKQNGHLALPNRRMPEASPADPALHPMLQLQQQAGNQAVQELLRSGAIQAKLAISSPGDPEEREADQMADQVMRMEENHDPFGSPCPCQLSGGELCDDCKKKQAGVQRKATESEPPAPVQEISPTPGAASVFRQVAGTPGGPDPCLDLLQQIIALLDEVAKRFRDAQDDIHELYKYHRRVEDADPDYGSWEGHRDRYYYDRDRLRQKRTEWDIDDDCRGYSLTPEQQTALDEAVEFGQKEYPPKPAESMRDSQVENESVWDSLRKYLPKALVVVLIAAGAYVIGAAIVACFASGACEIGAILAGLGFATAAAVGFFLRAAGVKDQPTAGPTASNTRTAGALQAKLAISNPGDPAEEEADRVAEHVVRAGEGHAFGAPCPCMASGGEMCEECKQRQATIHRQTAGVAGPAVEPGVVGEVLHSPGQPLDVATRTFMEPRFGRDFSQVRVHTDLKAAESARAVNALAYTVGQHVVFGDGRFAPATNEGQMLLAHELTHTLQQRGPRPAVEKEPGGLNAADEATARREGDSATREAKGNEPPRFPISSSLPSLARKMDPDREWQAACVRRLGGCSLPGGVPTAENIKAYNEECRKQTGYAEDVTPTDEECKSAVEHSNAPLSYELGDAPISSDPKMRVERWLRIHQTEIEAAETRFGVDRRAIAGAIAWEAIENVRSAWTPSSMGPGKVHVYKDLNKIYKHPYDDFFDEDTAAKQTEDAGYLPKQSLANRKAILSTSQGAINYIAAIMKAGADIAYMERGFEIYQDPLVLTWFYNTKDLNGWRALIKAKPPGSAFDTDPNPMSSWVKENLALLESAVGRPSSQPAHANAQTNPQRLQKSPENPNDSESKNNREEREAESAAHQVVNAPDAGASKSPAVTDGSSQSAETQSPTSGAAAMPSLAEGPQASTPQPDAVPATIPSATTLPAETPGGHTPNPSGMAACPDAPSRNIVVVGCTKAPAPTLPPAEKAVLPAPNSGAFGGDAERAKFAKDLAQCHAARVVTEEINKRYQTDIAAAKKRATEEAKADTDAAVKAATEGLDPKDKGATSRARTQAAAAAKKAAAKKIADAQAAVLHQDAATVTTELGAKFEDELLTDYGNTVAGALARFGPGWLRIMQSKLDNQRKRLTKEKSAKPKVAKTEAQPPAKSPEAIAAEVEADMVSVRCDQQEWALNQMEGINRAWAVGRREQVDFLTIDQKAAYLKDFEPTYEVDPNELVEIPASLQPQKNMPGVAPELADFLSRLAADPAAPAFKAGNYAGHGGGSWAGRGFSTDLFLSSSLDQRGFWPHQLAVRFLLALDSTAKLLGARWRVLYNDFGVAQEVNQKTGSRNVVFTGDSGSSKLNWHGPDPLILHFHLDLEIAKTRPPATSKP